MTRWTLAYIASATALALIGVEVPVVVFGQSTVFWIPLAAGFGSGFLFRHAMALDDWWVQEEKHKDQIAALIRLYESERR